MEDNNKRKKKWRPHISGTDAQLVTTIIALIVVVFCHIILPALGY